MITKYCQPNSAVITVEEGSLAGLKKKERAKRVGQEIAKICMQKGIEKVRLFNATGTITFSSDEAEIGRNYPTELGIVGDGIEGYGCPPMSPIACGLIHMELNRGDGSVGTFLGVQAGLAMQSIAMSSCAATMRRRETCRRPKRCSSTPRPAQSPPPASA